MYTKYKTVKQRTLGSLPQFSGIGMSKQNGSRLTSIIGKKHYKFLSFYRTFVTFWNEIIFTEKRCISFRRAEGTVQLFHSH